MALFKIPTPNFNLAVINNDVAAADVSLTGGKLTIQNTENAPAFVVKYADMLGFTKTAYAAGTASVKTLQFSGVVVNNSSPYTMTITLPNRIKDFDGGTESNAVIKQRTYTIYTDATATATEIRNAFLAEIQNDPQAGVTVASVSTTQMSVTLDDVNAGDTSFILPSGVTISIGTAYVAPSGTADIVAGFGFQPTQIATAGEYTTYEFLYRVFEGGQTFNGATARQHRAFVFLEQNAADFSAAETELDDILAGTADAELYLGLPSL